jgi:hypothetical protein
MATSRDPSVGGSTAPGAGAADGPGERLERFTPTSGTALGWCGIVIAIATVAYLAVTDHSVASLRLCLGVALAGLVVWATQVRPRVTTYTRELRLHGSVRDTYVPYTAISEVTLGQTLNVWVGRKRYVCVGIGRSVGLEMRQRVRSHNAGGLMGGNRSYQFAGKAEVTPQTTTAAAKQAYLTHVVDRITHLVQDARPERDRGAQAPVRHRVAVPEVVGLVVLTTALVGSLFL